MSSTSGVGVPTFSAPALEAENVSARIQSQIGRISSLFAEVQSILNQISALKGQAPVKGKKESDEDFQKRVEAFQGQLNQLNGRLQNAYRKLGQAQAILRRMQTQELPDAERRDAARMQKALDDMQKALEAASQTIAEKKDGVEQEDTDVETRVEIRAIERKLDIRIAEDPTLKEAIHAFAILAQVVGDPAAIARQTSPAVRMPPPGGSGLPPVGTP
jgi:peptidoglycan hydrolase CwlO-like protein